ncbi:Oidioi.mRNA.OKI2018_I69.PAR.g9645.t1.cds [Oikopleura dioica]|uniref:Oidioi.mRNA.OKI2018_I69.PAR.g9645.t1.cds n=1 Tax=Oikopleura dioica TaxID=34765 RepID=A0ABN7RQ31_OIKDI|nr:Oidioi.mRNA.OKI2018_I69.PAR.g9645.t1.cds [Oikopleura dioica]
MGDGVAFSVDLEAESEIFSMLLGEFLVDLTTPGDNHSELVNDSAVFSIFQNGELIYPAAPGASRRRRSTDNSDNLLGNEEVKALLLMQIMTNQQSVGVDNILPFVLLSDDRTGNVHKFVLFNAMSGGLSTQHGFDANFLILYKLMEDSSAKSSDKSDIALILFAMQSQNPSSSLDSMSLIPFLLMDDNSNNEELILFLEISRQRNRANCAHNRQYVPQIQQPRFVRPAQNAPVITIPVQEVSEDKWNSESLTNFLQQNPANRLY